MFRSLRKFSGPTRRGFHTFNDSIKDNHIYSFMYRKAIVTKNVELFKVMDRSEMFNYEIKHSSFVTLCQNESYETVKFMVDNDMYVKANLEFLIEYADKGNDIEIKKNLENNLMLLEQEL